MFFSGGFLKISSYTYLLGVKSHTAMPSKRVATYQCHHHHYQYNDHHHYHHQHHHYDQAKESQHLRVDPPLPLLASSTATSGVPNAAGKPEKHCRLFLSLSLSCLMSLVRLAHKIQIIRIRLTLVRCLGFSPKPIGSELKVAKAFKLLPAEPSVPIQVTSGN